MSGETLTYKCLLCGVDHLIVNGRVEHTIFSRSATADIARDAARYRALHPYLRACMEYDERGHVLRLGERTIPTGEKESGWTGELIDRAADYAVAIRSGTLQPVTHALETSAPTVSKPDV